MSHRGLRVGIDASNLLEGGGLTHLVEILASLDPSEHGIEKVFVWGSDHTLARVSARGWLHLIQDPELEKSVFHRLYWQRRILSQQAADRECDLLFVPGGTYTGAFRPFVTMSRNLLPFDKVERARFGLSKTRLRYHVLELAQRRTYQKAAGVIFLTNQARDDVMKVIPELPGRTAVIYHGVNADFARQPGPARAMSEYSDEDPFRWLYVSIVNWYKHQWHVASAVDRLRREGYPVILDLVGPAYPPALKRLERTIDDLDPKREFIRYHGAVPYQELASYYSSADGFVFASTCETFGQILLEAMRTGLPIACSDRSAMPEILGTAGAYFNSEDPVSIASALRQLMDNKDMRQANAAHAQSRSMEFSWDKCAKETFDFIVDVADRRSGEIRSSAF